MALHPRYNLSNFFSYLTNRVPTRRERAVLWYRLRCALLSDCTVEFRSVTLDLSHTELSDYLQAKFLLGRTYEDHEVELVEEYLFADTDVLELGSGVGYVSTIVNRSLDDAHHIAVEANEQLAPMLQNTKRLNDADFEVVNGVYKPGTDVQEFHVASNCFSSSMTAREDTEVDTTIEVPAVTLAELVEKFDIKQFQLVVDIEGAEFELIAEEREVLAKLCTQMIVEFHDFENTTIEESIDNLRAIGFEVVDATGDVYVLRQ